MVTAMYRLFAGLLTAAIFLFIVSLASGSLFTWSLVIILGVSSVFVYKHDKKKTYGETKSVQEFQKDWDK